MEAFCGLSKTAVSRRSSVSKDTGLELRKSLGDLLQVNVGLELWGYVVFSFN